MRCFLLGANEATLPLVASLRKNEQVRFTAWFDSDTCDEQLRAWFPGGQRIDDREAFVNTASRSNAFVLAGSGGNEAQRESSLRDLARDGIPLVLAQPACSAIFAVELDMIQRDTREPVIPLHADALHPAVSLMRQWAQEKDSPIGNLEQIVMERTAHDRRDEAVQAALSRDALILRRIAGDFERIAAMPSGRTKALSNLSVHLTGSLNALIKWSIGPVEKDPGATLSLIGDAGRISLAMPDSGAWELSSTGIVPAEVFEHESAAALSQHVERGLAGQFMYPSWEDAVRAMALADAASESVRRGKTLALNNERLTEEDTFKSMMAAGGCLIVLILPLLLLLVSLLDGLGIPSNKTSVIQVNAQQRTVALPPDLNALDQISIVGSGQELQLLTASELTAAYDPRKVGRPKAFSVDRTDLTLAPIPDQPLELEVRYEGSFNIWRGWPLILLVPILVFLLLQLLRFVFPKPANGSTASIE